MTGLDPAGAHPRRYLWTDAFAVPPNRHSSFMPVVEIRCMRVIVIQRFMLMNVRMIP